MVRFISTLIFVVLLVGCLGYIILRGGNIVSQKSIEHAIQNYLQQHPEEIYQALESYHIEQQKKAAETARISLSKYKEDIEKGPFAGNPNADIVIVEFFDYNCGYCRRVVPSIAQLLKEDPKVKIVFKELPILGPTSVIASKAALAVWQLEPGKYFDFYSRLMATRITGENAVLTLVKEMGMDSEAVKKTMYSPEITTTITRDQELAQTIGIHGTPAFVIGGELIGGAIDYESFKSIIAELRNEPQSPQNGYKEEGQPTQPSLPATPEAAPALPDTSATAPIPTVEKEPGGRMPSSAVPSDVPSELPAEGK